MWVILPGKQVLVAQSGSCFMCKSFAQFQPPGGKIFLYPKAGAGSPIVFPPEAGDGCHRPSLHPGQVPGLGIRDTPTPHRGTEVAEIAWRGD